jgi:phospholipase C
MSDTKRISSFQSPNQPKVDPIKHVVLLMLENHSFDEMLGCFQQKYPNLDGINPTNPPRFNTDVQGNPYYQTVKDTYHIRFDPKHELENVKVQLANGNQGFIQDFLLQYRTSNPNTQDCNNIMGYYERGFLPALHALAEDFTICDHWFASVPGPTWPNRFFTLSGTASGRVQMPEGELHPHLETIRDQTQATIFDRLNEKGKTWKIFYYDFPNSLIFANQRQPGNLANYQGIDEFFKACNAGAKFPDFAFIEPKYFGIDQNDDHPCHNIMKAEKLIADVYNAIRSNDSLWETTLLIVVFDEHGGFYDHVTPPSAVSPDDKHMEYDFKQLGVRVPAILVSPWVGRCVDNTIYDHTSLLKYLIEKWDLGPLGARTSKANSIGGAITSKQRPEDDTVAFIRVPFSELINNDNNGATLETSSHQQAIHILAAFIEHELVASESPIFSQSVSLVSFISRQWINIKSWMGKQLLKVGSTLASKGIEVHHQRVQKTTSVAASLINSSKRNVS